MTEHIITYSKIEFRPLEPVMEDIKIEDIAHALSLLCRANGHYSSFYSVAAHCINCYDEACARKLSPRIQLACLLHDASESYISDITRPVKRYLEEYLEIEKKLADAIYKKFLITPLNEYEASMVKLIDDSLMPYEFLEFTGEKLVDELPFLSATPDFYKGDMKQVEAQFLQIFNSIDLTKEEEVKETIKWIR